MRQAGCCLLYTSRCVKEADISHSFRNFEIAAGLETGNFKGPSFHDGDFYKTFEAVASLYASTKDPELDALMEKAIAVMAKAQREDGYVYTKAIIEQKKTGSTKPVSYTHLDVYKRQLESAWS